ncbi:hypothetical protein [Streptomyces capillispiralis]|uniref:Uncharacterized protein n=1 Tax=Streptomyces capillispiralis TaxID=68182 RepID=A0A561THS4_9ACTN|nr:hypothetical protein [Streptomyces capillispiralis]TWF86673.1 hypothetical protein FHX78_113661 [Streptomyces capillispiralis]GHH90923.1 hypothetical protein GCM10017779_13800 [Streptomyces capillispiralis]
MEQPEETADAPDALDTPDAPDAPEPSDTPDAEPVAPDLPAKRRRGRTVALICAAAVLGLVAGTCTGYLVQADREPTPLPPLSQPVLPQAKGEGPAPLSAAQDRRVKTEGDLRELLLDKPRGAKRTEGSDGWLDLAAYADRFEKPDVAFGELVQDRFRRAAVTGWEVGDDYSVDICLVQYRQEEAASAAEVALEGQYWPEQERHDSWPIPGTGEGRAYVLAEPETEDGYLPLYGAEAHAARGDVVMEIYVYGTKPVPKKMIMSLAERQMERL